MRSPSGPLFRRYDIVVILLFVIAAAALSGLHLVY